MRVHTIWAADHMALSTEEHTHDFFQLVCCKKGGGAELNVLPTLPVYGEDGQYSKEIMEIYERI